MKMATDTIRNGVITVVLLFVWLGAIGHSEGMPDYAYYYHSGNDLALTGHISKAIEAYEKALTLAEGDSIPIATNNLAGLYMKRATDEIDTDSQAALNDYRNAAYLLEYGWPKGVNRSPAQEKNRKIALESLALAYKKNKLRPDKAVHLQLAKELERQQNFREALVEYEQARKLSPEDEAIERERFRVAITAKSPRAWRDASRYKAKIVHKVLNNWYETRSEKHIAKVGLKIARDGSLLRYGIINSSGSPESDKDAIDAVVRSAPFEPLPPSWPERTFSLELTLDLEPKAYEPAPLRGTTITIGANFIGLTVDEKSSQAWQGLGGYRGKLQHKVISNWHPLESETHRAIVFLTLDQDGSLLESDIKKSSGNKSFDNVALEAIQNSVPFDPLPQNKARKSVSIEMTFELRVAED